MYTFVLFMLFVYFQRSDCIFGSVFIALQEDSTRNAAKCDAFSSCVPASSCPLINDLMDDSCIRSDRYFHRVNALVCSYMHSERHICCPPGGDVRATAAMSAARWCGDVIVKGNNYTGIGSRPWIARIGFMNKNTGSVRYACAGSIISQRFILTAAHCALAEPDGYRLVNVLVGEYDSDHKFDCNEIFCAPPVQSIDIAKVITHPGYESSTFKHDIALIVTMEQIKYGVLPLCLNDSPDSLFGTRADVIGWGKLAGQATHVGLQQSLSVPILTNKKCTEIYGSGVFTGTEQLCAGGERGKDVCAGFGGSPLVQARGAIYTQIGILSFGSQSCGSNDLPSVYTQVSRYYEWIYLNAQLNIH